MKLETSKYLNPLFYWDSLRWRFVALYYITWWCLQGLPMEGQPALTRWENVKCAWHWHRVWVMYPYNQCELMSLSEWLGELEEGGE